jgi:hypothetical protein
MNTAVEYWPDTNIVKSKHNGFVLGFSDQPVNWAKYTAHAGAGAKVTADVERRRKEGTDYSTFRGMSAKSDAKMRPHGGAYTRAKPQGESKAARLRGFLRTGPKDSIELGQLLGETSRHVRGLLQWDVDHGKIKKLPDVRPVRYALTDLGLAEAA